MTIDNGLRPQDVRTIIDVLQMYPEVETAILYGSRALGTHRNGSDVDLAIQGAGLNFSICSRIHSTLEEETVLPYFFDITDYNAITNQALKEHIDRVGRIMYASCDNVNSVIT